MIRTVEIYFRDLEPEAQANLLDVFETKEEYENRDIPISLIKRGIEVEEGLC